jgi:hypothetical protein
MVLGTFSLQPSKRRDIIPLRLLVLFTLFFVTVSCTTPLPPEDSPFTPTASQLKQFRKVALSVSAVELKVDWKMGAGVTGPFPLPLIAAPILGPLPVIVYAIVDYEVASSRGSSQRRNIESQFHGNLDNWSIIDTLFGYTIEEMKKGAMFQVDDANGRSPQQLRTDGYDGLIEIKVERISFQREGWGDKLNIYVKGTGALLEIASGAQVWKREELVANREPHNAVEYSEAQGRLLKQELDKMLRRLSVRLVSDIVHA